MHTLHTKPKAIGAMRRFLPVAVIGTVFAQQSARADIITDSVDAVTDLIPSITTGVAAMIAITILFVGFKLAKKLISKAG